MNSASKINLGCGTVFVNSPEWINLDFVAASPAVRQANLLKNLPLVSHSADCVYSSHFFEHIPKDSVESFLRECLRVLKPGGVLRLVLPDLEEMARTYLRFRDAGDHERADFLVIEIIDQCVRGESGGKLGGLYKKLRRAPEQNVNMISFVRERIGEDLRPKQPLNLAHPGGEGRLLNLKRVKSAIILRLQQYWIRLCTSALPKAFYAQNVSFAGVGEKHHWLWDFHQLDQALRCVGFVNIQRQTASTSAIADFPFSTLDLDPDGRPRKGSESMYVEASKPSLTAGDTKV